MTKKFNNVLNVFAEGLEVVVMWMMKMKILGKQNKIGQPFIRVVTEVCRFIDLPKIINGIKTTASSSRLKFSCKKKRKQTKSIITPKPLNFAVMFLLFARITQKWPANFLRVEFS